MRRQRKIKKVKKDFGSGDLIKQSVEKWVCPARPVGPEDRTGVETKNYGLKILAIQVHWTY